MERGLLLENVRLLDPENGAFSKPLDLLVEGDRIAAVGDLAPRAGVERLDMAGGYAVPGLWDCHVHLGYLASSEELDVDTVRAEFVRRGVLYVRDMGSPLLVVKELAARSGGPAVYYAGPMLEQAPLSPFLAQRNEGLPGLAQPVADAADVDRILDELVASEARLTKAFGTWDLELLDHYLAGAGESGLGVALDPGMPLFQGVPLVEALDRGVTSIEHAMSAWSEVLRDDLRARFDAIRSGGGGLPTQMPFTFEVMALGADSIDRDRFDAVAERFARSGALLCPTLSVADRWRSEPPPAPPGMSQAAWQECMRGFHAANVVLVTELARRGVPMLVGQDGFDPEGVLREMTLLESAGVDRAAILRGATLLPARWLGAEGDLGSLEPGRVADLLVLEADPLQSVANLRGPRLVVQRGRVVDTSTEK
ncbi:MAG: amidohydrolase family protein [Planctomycetes bacterium]|nr:amidohydrolase family protein [Planctomycetota bacterium]